jgi:hypothetical protein
LIELSFKENGEVYSEGLLAISNVALSTSPIKLDQAESFLPYLDKFILYLRQSLLMKDDIELIRVGIITIGDISRSIPGLFEGHLNQIVPEMLLILETPHYPAILKVTAITALGDIAMMEPTFFASYLERLLHSLFSAMELALTEPEDEEVT